MKKIIFVSCLLLSHLALAYDAHSYNIGNDTYTNYSDGSTSHTYNIGNDTYTNFSDGTRAHSYQIGDDTYTNYN